MKANEGTIDRGLRAVLGIVLLVVGLVWMDAMGGAVTGILAVLIGAVLLVTGLVGFCPAYALVGIKTCPLDR